METLQELIKSNHNYRRALVYLWCLAHERHPNGGILFDHWRSYYNESEHQQRVGIACDWLEKSTIPDDGLSEPGMWLSLIAALDQALEEHTAKLPNSLPLPVDSLATGWGRGQQYWILPRRQTGYLFKRSTKLDKFHPYHLILATQASEAIGDVNFVVRQPTFAWPSLLPPKLCVAIANFDDAVTLPDSTPNNKAFYEITSDESKRLTTARAIIDEAEAKGVHILLFPELTLSPANQQAIAEDLYLRRQNCPTNNLVLIGLGSFHESCPVGDANQRKYPRNRARLISGRDGRIQLEQDKFQAASVGEGDSAVDEAIHPAGQINALLTPIGVIAIAICKDLFDEGAAWIWSRLSPHWLLVPSMSEKLDRHREKTADMRKRHGCVSMVANQCALNRGYIDVDKHPSEAKARLHIVEISPK